MGGAERRWGCVSRERWHAGGRGGHGRKAPRVEDGEGESGRRETSARREGAATGKTRNIASRMKKPLSTERKAANPLPAEWANLIRSSPMYFKFQIISNAIEVSRYLFQNKKLTSKQDTLMEKLSLVLPDTPRFVPRQFGHCAVIGQTSTIYAARIASERVLGKAALGKGDPLAACAIWEYRSNRKLPKSSGLRKAAVEHQHYVHGVASYPLEHRSSNEMLCIRSKT
eukprot:Gb_24803 [translate_table: standard]